MNELFDKRIIHEKQLYQSQLQFIWFENVFNAALAAQGLFEMVLE